MSEAELRAELVRMGWELTGRRLNRYELDRLVALVQPMIGART